MVATHFKTSWRNIVKNKSQSLLNILGLSIGIACAGLIFLWCNDELTWDNNHTNKQALYQVRVNLPYGDNVFTTSSTPRPLAPSLLTEFPGIENTCRFSDQEQPLLFSIGDKSMYADGRYADPSLFSMFTLPFLEGDSKNPFNGLYSIVLTQKAAIKFFGTTNQVIGRTLNVDHKQNYVVTGLVKDMPQNSTIQFEWIIPFETNIVDRRQPGTNDDATDWNSFGPFTYVQLKKDASPATINNQLRNYIYNKSGKQKTTAFIFGMNKWHLYDSFNAGIQTGGGRIEQVRLLSIIAWIILLIACINFMNLSTARSERRAREVGVRKILGSGRFSLITGFITEAVLLSALAAIIAVVIIYAVLPAYNTLVQKQLHLDLSNPIQILSLIATILITGIIAGSYPAFYLSSFKPASIVKSVKLKSGSAAIIRKGLVVLQFAVSIVFIITTAIVVQQIQYVKNRNLGFNKNNLLEVSMQQDFSGIFPAMKQQLLQTGMVENVAMADQPIISGGNTDDRFKWEGKSENSQISIAFRYVSPEFVATSGMKLLEGRDFDNASASNNFNVIISKSFADLLGKENAVGTIIQSPRGQKDGEYKNMTVIGVVDDNVYGNMFETPGPKLYFCGASDNGYLLYVRIKNNANLSEAVSDISDVVKQSNPAYPVQYKFVDDDFNQKFQNEMLTSKLSGIFAALSIIISCLGLFGLSAYTAEVRVKEFGIRKVLGASVASITRLLLKDFVQLIVVSCVLAFPIAWWMMKGWLDNYSYRITISWWIFLLAGSVAIAIALFTIISQALKAAFANPIKALRAD